MFYEKISRYSVNETFFLGTLLKEFVTFKFHILMSKLGKLNTISYHLLSNQSCHVTKLLFFFFGAKSLFSHFFYSLKELKYHKYFLYFHEEKRVIESLTID